MALTRKLEKWGAFFLQQLFSGRLLCLSLLFTFFLLPISTTAGLVGGIASFVIWVLSGVWLKSWRTWLEQPWFFPLISFVSLPLLGLLWTSDFENGVAFAEKGHYWCMTFVISSAINPFKVRGFFYAFLAGLSLNALIASVQYVGLLPIWVYADDRAPVYGLFSQHISSSLFLVFGLLLLSRIWKSETSVKCRVTIAILFLINFIHLALSRGKVGYFAFFCLAPVLGYQFLGVKWRKWVPAFILIAIFALFIAPSVRTTLERAIQGDKQVTSLVLRWFMWKGAVKIFADHPWFGVGTGGYREKMIPYKKELSHYTKNPEIESCCTQPHNSFLYAAANFGIVGLVILLWLFYVFLKKGWQARETLEGFAILIYGVIMIIGSLTDTQICSFSTAVLFALLLGLSVEKKRVNL